MRFAIHGRQVSVPSWGMTTDEAGRTAEEVGSPLKVDRSFKHNHALREESFARRPEAVSSVARVACSGCGEHGARARSPPDVSWERRARQRQSTPPYSDPSEGGRPTSPSPPHTLIFSFP